MTPDDFRTRLNSTADLTRHEWAVGHALAAFMDCRGRCWPSVETLARLTRLGESTVRVAINGSKRTDGRGLVSKGLITAERRRRAGAAHNLSTLYTAAAETTRRAPADRPPVDLITQRAPSVDHPTGSVPEEVESFTVRRRRAPSGDQRLLAERFPPHGVAGDDRRTEQANSALTGASEAMVADCGDAGLREREADDHYTHVPVGLTLPGDEPASAAK
jgi:hypothetical protein